MNESSSQLALKKESLTHHEEIAPGVFVIGWRRTHDFQPGQVVKLALDPGHPPRIYSLCSGAEDDTLRVLFNIKPEGFLTPKLAMLNVGDPLFASPPYGTFLGTNEPAWWIATGTGIAPFHSMVRSGMGHNKVLLHGARTVDQFYFSELFSEALGTRYQRCCSAEQASEVFSGRVTGFLALQDSLPKNQPYYICGQAGMAVEARDLLIEKGIPFKNIVTEIYF